MDVRYLPNYEHAKYLDTTELRSLFLLQALFSAGQIRLVYSHVDRMIVGGAVPTHDALVLEAGKELAAECFAERREIGIINIGGAGSVSVDGKEYPTEKYEIIYVGRGSRDIRLSSANRDQPARFFLVSLPAHAAYPTTHIKQADANTVRLGNQGASSERTIYQYIHEDGVESCQLVMGYTALESGNVWNTMPAHTHDRRSEVYMYFDLGDAVVFHLMGRPSETRHIVMREGEAVISPGWSIHAGVGTTNYCFVWAMGGENQSFADMDMVAISDLT
ncbi:MAG: 5-dehydro-4-deoxy-D-glucuronate isomerase [Anaerolineae bacterium]|nr:5-dehydro-4-deoxy-D-glucuronate isomerase [Anaerolineae bacterium]